MKLATSQLLRYALFGIPLGFVGLPLYVHLPNYYAQFLSLSLSTIGLVLFVTRLLDCVADPWIGYFSDRLPHLRGPSINLASLVIAVGVFGLFMLPRWFAGAAAITPLVLLLAATYLAYSVLMINFYANGLGLAQNDNDNTIVSAWREGAVIVGVLIASSLPQVLIRMTDAKTAYEIFAGIFIAVMALAWLFSGRDQTTKTPTTTSQSGWQELLGNKRLRRIFALFFLNAIPPSITATLFLFFVADILHLSVWSGAFLLTYFLGAILSMPLWTKLSLRLGKRRTLMLAMAVAITSFVWAYRLGEGQSLAYTLICLLSGTALGGDLTLLPSMLADALRQEHKAGGLEFGMWNFISKFTLALAAGIALPMLDRLGYVPNTSNPHGLWALSFTYALLPCLFKLAALTLLYFSPADTLTTLPRRTT